MKVLDKYEKKFYQGMLSMADITYIKIFKIKNYKPPEGFEPSVKSYADVWDGK